MAVLAVLVPNLTGALRAPVAPTAGTGDLFTNDGNTVLIVNNASGGSINVTFDAAGAIAPDQANAFDADVVKPVAAGASRIFGPFVDKARWNDANGQVKVICSAVATITIEAVRLA